MAAENSNVTNLLGMARTAELGGNSAEALSYYNRVLEIDPTVSEAWMGKGNAAVWQSNLMNIRIPEALIAFNHAIANAEADKKDTVTSEAVDNLNRAIVAIYGMARNHMIDFVNLDNSWPTYINQVAQLIDGLEAARQWKPLDRTTLENIIHLAKDNIEGYSYRDQYNNNMAASHSISAEYEKFLRERLDQAVEAIREIDPSFAPPAIEKKQADACFIVTATMGDFNHPDVILLRQFRDRWIRQRMGGNAFVAAYYRIGPTLASIIERNGPLRRLSYRYLVQPAVRFAKRRNW